MKKTKIILGATVMISTLLLSNAVLATSKEVSIRATDFWDDIANRLTITEKGSLKSKTGSTLGNIYLSNTTNTSQSGLITKNGLRFIHDFNYGNNGQVTTIGRNTFVGLNAGNLTMGKDALVYAESSYNTGVGAYSLFANTTGFYNATLGAYALYSNTTGVSNTANGALSLYNNTTGGKNTANGGAALFSNTEGVYNSADGNNALGANTLGSRNTAVGAMALNGNTLGNSNVALGTEAGSFSADNYTENSLGNNSIFIGANTKANSDSETNQIVIGYDATGVGDNSVVLGNDNITKTILKGNVGIGTSSLGDYKLEVEGDVKINGQLSLQKLSLDQVTVANGQTGLTQRYALKDINEQNCELSFVSGILVSSTCQTINK